MGKKQSQASAAKAPKNDKKQMNSLIKVLRPKVYITDSSNFKRLVQELTGDGNPMPFAVPPAIPEPVMEAPMADIDHDHASWYRDRSLDSSVDSSEASMPASFMAIESPGELCVPDTFNVLESSFASHHHKVDFPGYGDIESWLMETDSNSPLSYNYDASTPTIQEQVTVYNYDFSDLII